MKNLKFLLGVALVGGALLSSCSKDDDNTDTSTVTGTQAAVDAACDSWKTARKDWEWSEAFLFGAAGDYEIDPHIDTWPVDQTALAQLLRNKEIMDNIDAEISKQDDGLLGFHGLEYVLFRDGAPRSIDQITELEFKYAVAVAKDLYKCTSVLQACWAGKENVPAARQALVDAFFAGRNDQYQNYGAEFTDYGEGKTYETANDATVQILEGARDIIGEVSSGKIGKPHTGEDANYIESPYAYNSIQDFYDNIEGCKFALYGRFGAQQPQENSVIKFCQSTQQLSDKANDVVAALDNALDKIKNMKAPFVKYYKDSSAQDAMDALDKLDGKINTLEETLKTYKNNAEVEAKLKDVNINYINNVVVPTYAALADNAEIMVSKIIDISK